jgi:hypothetical protein
MEEHVHTFIARDAAGRNVVMQVWRQIESNGAGELHDGATRITTHDGRAVERMEKGRYELVSSREPILSDAPDAP